MSEPIVRLIVEGDPVPKGRPRLGRARTYTPKATRQAEAVLQWQFKRAMQIRPPVTGPVRVTVAFGVRRRSGDLDNLVKLVLDAANGIVWHDDRQVMALEATKHEAPVGETAVEVWPMAER